MSNASHPLYDIVAVGESLIDCIPEGTSESGTPLIGAHPGGAPMNVLAMAAKLGLHTAIVSKVGDDGFGRQLIRYMKDQGIDTDGVVVTREYPTTLAMVHLDEQGERSFSFYRHGCADVALSSEEVPSSLLERTGILHFGSVSLTEDPSRTATLDAVKRAKAAGAVISYDPNYRPLLWDSKEEAVRRMAAPLPLCDIVKVSDEEMTLLTGETDVQNGAMRLLEAGPALVFVTCGGEGAVCRTAHASASLPAYDVRVVDTTGAGDAFLGAALSSLCGRDRAALVAMTDADLRTLLAYASAAGALTTEGKGAVSAMPSETAIRACMDASHFKS